MNSPAANSPAARGPRADPPPKRPWLLAAMSLLLVLWLGLLMWLAWR
jgi:hypothetical protein